ncbi:GntR family transcriptional regulator [Streptomyces solaniscabiei]|uniref:GntR family transcriptional regulator n=1 Tax=Streptomyces solaniscabiei TaxID=2683255 RepID=UPI001CE280AB|nr:GntR family transcriptional regulator [Streptomyces solaniscabiei]
MTKEAPTQPTMAERVADILRREIQQRSLEPGAPLRQNEVAARLGVSSTPVREAFQILERAGLVVREGRRGVRVFEASARDLINTFEVRVALESTAARLATNRMTEADRTYLGDIMKRMHAGDVPAGRYVELNAELHAHIARSSGNAHLEHLIIVEQAATATYIAFLGVDPSSAHEAHEEHTSIYVAIRDGDADAAAEAMRSHLVARLDALQKRLHASDQGNT